MNPLRLINRLSVKMLALLLLASAIPVCTVATLAFLRVRTMVLEDAGRLLSARTDQLLSELDGFHNGYLGAIRRLASFRDVAAFVNERPPAPETLERTRAILQNYLQSDANIRQVALFDEQGSVALTTDTDPRTRTSSIGSRAFFRAARKGSATVSDIFLVEGSAESLPMIAYCAPVFGPEGQPIGVVAIYLRADAFWDAVRTGNGRAGPNSFSVLYDASGIRIAHSFNQEEVFRPGGSLDSAVLEQAIAENRFGERTMTLLASPSVMPEEFARERAPLLNDRELFRGYSPGNGKWNLGVARRLRSVPWTLISQIPEDSLDQPVQGYLLTNALAGALICALALGLGIYGARRMLRPLKQLSVAADAIARGEKDVRVHITTRDELGILGEHFNAMASAVGSAQQDLEARVRERTLALERLNEELQSQKGELLAQQDELRAKRSELEDKNRQVAYADRLKSEFLTNRNASAKPPKISLVSVGVRNCAHGERNHLRGAPTPG